MKSFNQFFNESAQDFINDDKCYDFFYRLTFNRPNIDYNVLLNKTKQIFKTTININEIRYILNDGSCISLNGQDHRSVVYVYYKLNKKLPFTMPGKSKEDIEYYWEEGMDPFEAATLYMDDFMENAGSIRVNGPGGDNVLEIRKRPTSRQNEILRKIIDIDWFNKSVTLEMHNGKKNFNRIYKNAKYSIIKRDIDNFFGNKLNYISPLRDFRESTNILSY